MVQIQPGDRKKYPAFFDWVGASLKAVESDAALWQRLLAATESPKLIMRDALSGGTLSPVLELALLKGGEGGTFLPATHCVIKLDRRLAERFTADPADMNLQRLTRAILLTQVVAWRCFNNDRADFRTRASTFAAEELGAPTGLLFRALFGEERLTIRATLQDCEDLVRLTIAEAGGAGTRQGRDGQAAIIFVVLNRVASSRFPTSIRGVIDADGEFEPVLRAPGKTVTGLPVPKAADRTAVTAIINDIIADRLTDPTFGATFFQNRDITRGRGSEYAKGIRPHAVIANHTFFDRYKANDPVMVPAWRLVRG